MIFCDWVGGENKNFTFIRFIHSAIQLWKSLNILTITYYIRDVPIYHVKFRLNRSQVKDWIADRLISRIYCCQTKPRSFSVVDVDQCLVPNWRELLTDYNGKKQFMPSRPVEQLKVLGKRPSHLFYRNSYNGYWMTHIPKALPFIYVKIHTHTNICNELTFSGIEFILLEVSYST